MTEAESGRERWHGTPGGYSNHHCRCDDCRAANTVEQRRHRARRRGMPVPVGVVHGAACAVNYGCRCAVCLTSMSDRNALRHRGKSDG